MRCRPSAVLLVAAAACGGTKIDDGGLVVDAGAADASGGDADLADAGSSDAAPADGAGAAARTADVGPAADAGAPSLRALSDAFDGTQLDPRWSVLRAEAVEVVVGGGVLALRPTQYVLWFNAARGVLVHQAVTGDFKVTATVHARRAADGTAPPTQRIHLGGLMARSPAGTESYVFIVLGYDENDLSIETKTTTNGSSTYAGPPWPSGDAQLRICRTGETFRLYKRAIGAAAWTAAATYVRPDLPATLEVGANVYAASPMPDLRVTYDEIAFDETPTAASCETP